MRLSATSHSTVVAMLALTVTASYGVLMYAFPVVLVAMSAELGWSQQLLMGAYSLGALVTGVAAIPVGRWIDHSGSAPAMCLSAIVASALVVAWSQVSSVGMLYLVWVGLGTCAAGLFYEPAFATIVRCFDVGRARAFATITVAGGLASTIFVPLTAHLTVSIGWRDAVLWLAALLALFTILPHALLLRSQSRVVARDGDRISLATSSSATIAASRNSRLTLAFVLTTLASMAFIVHLIPILRDFGHALPVASLALAALGLTKLVGRVLFASLVSRAGIMSATSIVIGLQAVGIFVLVATSVPLGIAVCVLLVGVGEGASTPARAELIAVVHGTTGYGTASGVLASFLAGARAVGPIALSFLYAVTGGYRVPLLVLAATLLLATALLRSAGGAVSPRRQSGLASFSACVRLPD